MPTKLPKKLTRKSTIHLIPPKRDLRVVREWRVRQMIPGERFPFKTGIEYMKLDAKWVWVLIRNGKAVAMCAGCDAHKLFIFIRIVAAKTIKADGILLLLRQTLRDAKMRGCQNFTAYLMPESKVEERLLRIAARCGAAIMPTEGAWVFADMGKIKGLAEGKR